MTCSRLIGRFLEVAAVLAFTAAPPMAKAQSLEAEIVRNPDDTVTYTIDLDGPPRGSAYVALPLYPIIPNPLFPTLPTFSFPPVFSWIGTFSLNDTSLFDFNFKIEQIENPGVSQFIISDGDLKALGDSPFLQRQILPGLTCQDPQGCEPINFVFPFLPFDFPPLNQPAANASVFVDVAIQASDLSGNFAIEDGNGQSLELNFLTPPNFYLPNLFDPSQVLQNPTQALQLLNPASFLLPGSDLFLDPLGPPGSGTLLIPPNPALAGFELATQALVVDPQLPVLPTMRFNNLQPGDNVRIGNSLVITVSNVPVPTTLALLGLGLVGLRLRRAFR